MKYNRSQRLIDITALLVNHPYQLFSLTDFTQKYQSAKSSISEDIAIIKEIFAREDIGLITSYVGAIGGVKYSPYISQAKQVKYAESLIDKINDYQRVLPGGYFYLTDILSDTQEVDRISLILASQHTNDQVDYVLTAATKGIPLAQGLARKLNVPAIVARQGSKVTEGPSVSIKYTSQSAPRLVQSMEIGRNSIQPGSNLILVDDFLRGEGTMNALESLVDIFDSNVIAKYVICENVETEIKRTGQVKSLVKISGLLNDEAAEFRIERGSLFEKN